MALSEKEVIHIADLARIKIGEDEKKRFGKELAAILDFIGELDEIDTSGVVPMTGGTKEESIFRSDEPVSNSLEGEGADLVGASPKKKNGYVSVPSIFE